MSFAQEFSFSPWFTNIDKYNRMEICTLNRLRSGHNKTRSHLSSKGFRVEETCDCGEGLHSLHHLIWECALTSSHRSTFFNSCTSKKIPLQSDLTMISFKHPEILSDLLNFLSIEWIPVYTSPNLF